MNLIVLVLLGSIQKVTLYLCHDHRFVGIVFGRLVWMGVSVPEIFGSKVCWTHWFDIPLATRHRAGL